MSPTHISRKTVPQTLKNTHPKRLTDRKRDAIIKAALVEFRENGYLQTSMDRIASRAEVSKRTVYNHFENKHALFAIIVSNLFSEVRKTSTIPFDAEKPLRDQLHIIVRQQIKLMTSIEFVELARITFSEYIRSPELAREVFVDLRDDNPTFFQWVCDAIDAGKLKTVDPIVPAKQFVSMIKAFFLWPQLFGSKLPANNEHDAIIETTIDMFLGYYKSNK